jgi:hypothetical protein
MVDEHQRDRDRTKAIERGDTAAPLWFIPNGQPTDAANGSNPPGPRSRTTRRGLSPARFSARC